MSHGFEGTLDDQSPAATWAGQCEDPGRRISVALTCATGVFTARWFGPKQVPDPGDIGGPVAVSIEAVVADAVLAFWQNVDQEPSDEL